MLSRHDLNLWFSCLSPPKCWNYWYVPPHSVWVSLFIMQLILSWGLYPHDLITSQCHHIDDWMFQFKNWRGHRSTGIESITLVLSSEKSYLVFTASPSPFILYCSTWSLLFDTICYLSSATPLLDLPHLVPTAGCISACRQYHEHLLGPQGKSNLAACFLSHTFLDYFLDLVLIS